MKGGLLILLLLSSAGVAGANDIICGNEARPSCANTVGMTRYLESQESSSVGAGCHVIPDDAALTQAQRTLMAAPSTHAGALFPRLAPCYVTVSGGIGVEMSLAEKQAVDAAQAAINTAKQAYRDDVLTNPACNATRAELVTLRNQLRANLQTDIDAITNIASAKTELSDMMDRLINVLGDIIRCVRGRAER